MTVDVSVVVVTYNAPEWTVRCLDRLLSPDLARSSTEVVVVDNASDAPLRDQLPGFAARGARVLAQEENLGFGRACNLGVRASSGRHVLLVNPDAVLHDGAVDALVDFLAERPEAGIVGGRTVRPDGTTDPSSCWGQPTTWSHLCFALGLSTVLKRNPVFDPESLGRWERDSVREVGVVTGCLLMATRATWDELGGFDERYFMYGEDADLSRRARRRGYRPAITPAAVVTHAVGASSSSTAAKRQLLFTGKATLVREHGGRLGAPVGLALLQVGVLLRALPGLLLRRESSWSPVWMTRATWRSGWGDSSRSTRAVTDAPGLPSEHGSGAGHATLRSRRRRQRPHRRAHPHD